MRCHGSNHHENGGQAPQLGGDWTGRTCNEHPIVLHCAGSKKMYRFSRSDFHRNKNFHLSIFCFLLEDHPLRQIFRQIILWLHLPEVGWRMSHPTGLITCSQLASIDVKHGRWLHALQLLTIDYSPTRLAVGLSCWKPCGQIVLPGTSLGQALNILRREW